MSRARHLSSKTEPDRSSRHFHRGDKPLTEIAGELGVRREAREAETPEHRQPESSLLVVFSVKEDQGRRDEVTAFSSGYFGRRSRRTALCVSAELACRPFLGQSEASCIGLST